MIIPLKERVGAEYNTAKEWARLLKTFSIEACEFYIESTGSSCVNIASMASYPVEAAQKTIKDYFMPSIFITAFKMLDELLAWVYETITRQRLNTYMGYSAKSDLFNGLSICYKKISYPPINLALPLPDPLKFLSGSIGIRLANLHGYLTPLRNILVHKSSFSVHPEFIEFTTLDGMTKLPFRDVINILYLVLLSIDQVVNGETKRKVQIMEHCYSELSLYRHPDQSNIPFSQCKVILDIVALPSGYKTNFLDVEARFKKFQPFSIIDYVQFSENNILRLIPMVDVIDSKLDLSFISDLNQLDIYVNKCIPDFEDLRDIE